MSFQSIVASILILAVSTVGIAQDALSIQQVLALIEAGVPDELVAAEIAARGIEEPIDRDVISRVRRAGGGRLVVAALERLRPISTLVVTGVPGTKVSVDGAYAGQLDDGGDLLLSGLSPGQHEVGAELSDHAPQRLVVLLPASEETRVELRLDSLFGSLTLTSNVTDALFKIEPQDGTRGRRATIRGSYTNPKIGAGAYRITVEAPGYGTYNESLTIGSGESAELTISLTSLSELLIGLISESVLDDSPGAVARLRELLERGADPNSKNTDGDTALLIATRDRADLNLITALIQAGADPTVGNPNSLAIARNQERTSAVESLLDSPLLYTRRNRTFFREGSRDEYIVLRPDRTFTVRERVRLGPLSLGGPATREGSYHIEETIVYLVLERSGVMATATLVGDRLTESNGKVWRER